MSNCHAEIPDPAEFATSPPAAITPDLASRRQRLTTLIGRLLARHWLDAQRPFKKPNKDDGSPPVPTAER